MGATIAPGTIRAVAGASPATLSSITGYPDPGVKAQCVTIYCPDGGDGLNGPPANSDAVWVSGGRDAAFPLGPGRSTSLWNQDPYAITVWSETSNQLVFVNWGGEPPDGGK